MSRNVRDEGVAGSNPATPTKYPLAALNFHNYPHAYEFEIARVHTSVHGRVLRMVV